MSDLIDKLRGIEISVVRANRALLGTTPVTSANELVRAAADRLEAQEALLKDAMMALDALMEVTEPPERNCSCHINPPCGWCVEYEMVAIEHKRARATLAKLLAHLDGDGNHP